MNKENDDPDIKSIMTEEELEIIRPRKFKKRIILPEKEIVRPSIRELEREEVENNRKKEIDLFLQGKAEGIAWEISIF